MCGVCVWCVCVCSHCMVRPSTHSSGVSRAGSLAATSFVSSSRPHIAASRTLQKTVMLDSHSKTKKRKPCTYMHELPCQPTSIPQHLPNPSQNTRPHECPHRNATTCLQTFPHAPTPLPLSSVLHPLTVPQHLPGCLWCSPALLQAWPRKPQ